MAATAASLFSPAALSSLAPVLLHGTLSSENVSNHRMAKASPLAPRLQVLSTSSRSHGESRRIRRTGGWSPVIASSAASSDRSEAAQTSDAETVNKQEHEKVPAESESTSIQSAKGNGAPSRTPMRTLAGDLEDFFPTVRSLRQMLDSMDRMFDDPFFSPVRQLRPMGTRQQLRSSIRTPWDVMEEENVFLLRVDIPGFSKDQVKVYVEEGHLVIKANQDSEEESDKFSSRSYGNFTSRLLLPENVDFEKISAELKNGVLVITVPKLQKAPKKDVIDIHVE